MADLTESIEEIEIYYRQQKKQLWSEKISFFCLSVVAVYYGHYYVLGYSRLHHLQLTRQELLISDAATTIIIFSCFLFSPLYKFISDRIFLKMNWDIKTSIFKTILNNYTHDYHLEFSGELPDEDIANLEFEKGLFDFCSEKDLIFGKINHHAFRISVVNKVSIFSKRFNGIVGVIVLEKQVNADVQQKIKNIISNYKNLELLKIANNKIYIGSEGKKKYFEFEIVKGLLNRQDLMDDYNRFKNLAEVMNELSG